MQISCILSCSPTYNINQHYFIYDVNFFTVIEEGGVKMKLTVVDTPGFGDQINNDNWWVFPTPGSLKPHKCHHYCLILPRAVFLLSPYKTIFLAEEHFKEFSSAKLHWSWLLLLFSVSSNLFPLCRICSWEPISKFINEQYEKFLKEEVNITRKKRIPDTRVHCCLYFISPTGHSWVTLQ